MHNAADSPQSTVSLEVHYRQLRRVDSGKVVIGKNYAF